MKKLLLLGLVLILLSSIVFAGHNLTEDLEWYYPLNSSTLIPDYMGFDNNGTNSGASLGQATAKYGKSAGIDNTDYITVDSFTSGTSDFAYGGWVYMTAYESNVHIFDIAANYMHLNTGGYQASPANTFNCLWNDGVWKWSNADHTFSLNTWYHIICSNDGSNMRIYINGQLNDTVATGIVAGGGGTVTLGGRGPEENMAGYLDEVFWYSDDLNNSEALQLYESTGFSSLENSTIPPAPPAPTIGSINVTILTPINGATYGIAQIEGNNSNIQIGGVHNESSWVSCTINDTDWSSGINTTYNFTFNNNTALTGGVYSLEVFCGNSTVNGTDTVNLYVDLTYPSIDSVFINGTTVYKQNLTGQFNFTDDYALFSYNISIDGITVSNKTITGIAYQYNLSLNVSSYYIGQHTLTVTAADGHTANKIYPYKVKKGLLSNYLEYEKGSTTIKINSGLLDKWSTEKLKDRYTFEYEPFSKSKKHTFTIETNQPIYVIDAPNAKWKKWLIVGDQWLDFYIPAETYTLYIDQINSKKVRVTVESGNFKDKEKIKFHSIGDLNIITKEYTFNNINVTSSFESPVLERSIGDYTLTLIKNSSSVSSSASFIFDGSTSNGVTKTSTNYSDVYTIAYNHPIAILNNQSLSFNWSLNYTNGGTTNNYQVNDTNTLFKFALGNCNSTFNTTVINFTVKDSNTATPISGYNYEALFTVWHTDNTSYTKEYGFTNLTLTGSNKICMFPYFANLKTNYDSLFSHTLYDDTHYIIANGDLSSTMETIPVLMVNSSLATGITVTVVDQTGQPISSYVIEASRYNLAENNYTLITTQISNGDGQALFYLDVTTYEYKFTVKDTDGVIVYTEPKQKLINTEYTFQIPIGTNAEVVVLSLYNLDYTLTPNRATKTFTLDWTEISYASSRINLTVSRYNSINGTQLVSSQSSIANTGTLSYIIVDSTANQSVTYTAKVYMVSIKDSNEYYITSETIDFREEWDIFGTESLVMTFIFVGTMIFIGAAVSPILALVLCIFSMVILWWLGFYIVSLSALVGVFVSLVLIMVKLKR